MNEPEMMPEEKLQVVEESKAEVDPLEELKDIDLLLEDIEDKIAPLAL